MSDPTPSRRTSPLIELLEADKPSRPPAHELLKRGGRLLRMAGND